VLDATGRQLEIKGDLTIAMSLPPELAVSDVTLANAPWSSQPQMAQVGELRVRLRILPLLKRDIDIKRIKLIDTNLLLETDTSGQANWRFSHKASSRTGVGMKSLAVTSKALALTGAQATIGQQSIKIALAGRIDDLMTLKGIRLDVKGSGKSLGELRSLVGDKLPDTGPFSATARLTGSAQGLAVAKLRASVRRGNAQLAVSGKVADVMKRSGIDLGVEGSGKNLGELGPLFDTQLPDLGPFRINGQLSGSDNSLELKNFTAAVDQSDFAGWAKLEFGKRPRVQE